MHNIEKNFSIAFKTFNSVNNSIRVLSSIHRSLHLQEPKTYSQQPDAIPRQKEINTYLGFIEALNLKPQ